MYNLYLDESGVSSVREQGIGLPHFSIAGIMIHETSSMFINERAKQIKFKYFGKTDIVFHSYDIVNNEKDFAIFKNQTQLKDEFNRDLKNFLTSASFKVMYVGINKEKYINYDPTIKNLINKGLDTKKYEQALVRRMIKTIFKNYLCYLKCKSKKDKICTGKITMEGAGENQDSLCFNAYHSIMGGCTELDLTNIDVRNFLTCISFVTKKNNSIEVELADMAAYFLNLEHRHRDGKVKHIKQNSKELINIFSEKLFKNKCPSLSESSWQDLSST